MVTAHKNYLHHSTMSVTVLSLKKKGELLSTLSENLACYHYVGF
jgi:hypothetical protein